MKKLLIFALLVLLTVGLASAATIENTYYFGTTKDITNVSTFQNYMSADADDYTYMSFSSTSLSINGMFDAAGHINFYTLDNNTLFTNVTVSRSGSDSTRLIYFYYANGTLISTVREGTATTTWNCPPETQHIMFAGARYSNTWTFYSIGTSTIISHPSVNVKLLTPDNETTNNLKYSVSGIGEINSTLFIDDVKITLLNGSGIQTYYPDVSQGAHTWYVNASSKIDEEVATNQSETRTFVFDNIYPTISSAIIDPNYEKIANGSTVSIDIDWYDANLKNASFFVDYGSGYVLEDNITFSGTSGWFNTSINTTGYTGKNISWYQMAYDEAGNSYNYSDSFEVILNQLSIYVYDETTGSAICPDQVRIYNTDYSHFASINTETNVSSLSYSSVSSGKYIVSVTKKGYYARNSIIDVDVTTLSELNMYLINKNQTVIYDQFNLIDYTRNYDYDDVIIRLDKPLTDGTQTVFSSYFDYAGTTATYLTATDQYILHIITPDSTISYGWLTPDADGEVDIVVNNYELTTSEEWLDYDYSFTDSSLSFDYVSSKTIDQASLNISLDGVNIYSVSSESDSGSFLYNSFTQNGTYFVTIQVTAEDGTEFLKQEYKEIGDGEKVDLFPTSYSLLMKSVVVVLIMVTGVLVLSSYRFDLAAIWIASLYGLSVSQEWIYGNTITVAVMSLLCLAALVKFHRKQNRLV